MSDPVSVPQPGTPMPVASAGGVDSTLPAQNATPTPTPTPAAPAADGGSGSDQTDPLEGMTAAQIDELAQRIEAARANRPPSLADQIAALQQQLTDSHRGKESAVETRKAAAAEANDLEQTIAKIHETLRRTELVEAATVAQFANPHVVADALLGRDGDVTTLIAEAVKSGGYAMNRPATSAPVGSNGKPPAGIDAGMAALIDEINRAHGR